MEFRSKSGQRDRVLQHYLKGILFCDRCERNERTSRLIYTEAKNRFGNCYGYFLCRGRQEGICDLPYLPAGSVERAIVCHYATLNLPSDFVVRVRKLVEEALTGEQHSVAELHAALSRKLKELEAKEDRLLDLLADDQLPTAKVKAKLRKIQSERSAAQRRTVSRVSARNSQLAQECCSTQSNSCQTRRSLMSGEATLYAATSMRPSINASSSMIGAFKRAAYIHHLRTSAQRSQYLRPQPRRSSSRRRPQRNKAPLREPRFERSLIILLLV
jgi:hypothetical protein